jgi:hypothetical protein
MSRTFCLDESRMGVERARELPIVKGAAMSLSTATTVVGVFEDQAHAAKAIPALKQGGFTDAQIGIASRELARQFEGVAVKEQHRTEHGALAGALVGGGVGAALGLAGAAFIPGVAPLLAGSLLLGALGGGAAGASVGVFAGTFIALGMSHEEAERNARHVEEGKAVLFVYAPGRQDEARAIMVDQGAFDESMAASP